MGKTRKAELLPGTLDMLILKTLARSGTLHGYGVAESIRETTDGVLDVEEGSLYPALQRLMLEGWVDTEWGKSDNNRRARFYRLTPDGRKQLAREVASFERTMEAVLRVLRPA